MESKTGNTPCQDKNQNHLYQALVLPRDTSDIPSRVVMFCQFCGDVRDLVAPNPQPAN